MERPRLFPLHLLALLIAGFILLHAANPSLTSHRKLPEGQTHPSTQLYDITTGPGTVNTLRLFMHYARWQNATFTIAPQMIESWSPSGCVEEVGVRPLPAPINLPERGLQQVNAAPFCNEMTFNLAPYLHPGKNQIVIKIRSNALETLLYVTPKLFGADILSTLGCLCIFAAAASFLHRLAQRVGLDETTSALAVAGLGYEVLWLHFRANMSGVLDVPGHVGYIMHMADHWMRPYDYTNWESFHPPLYYFLASRIFILAGYWHTLNPLLAVRLLGLALYTAFCLYGLRALNEATERKGLAYYVGVLLIVFWPVGGDLSTNIGNDMAAYAIWDAAFYYLARWFRQRELWCLQLAIVLNGIGFMIKSSAWVVLGMIGACVLYALLARRLRWRQLFQGRSLLAFAALLLGITVNFGRIIYMKLAHEQNVLNYYFGDRRREIYPFDRFDLHDFLVHPFSGGSHDPTFWNGFLKTMLYNSWQWTIPSFMPHLPAAINLLLLIFLAIAVAGMILHVYQRRTISDSWPYLMGVAFPLAGTITFVIVDQWWFSMNFRYVLPMFVPLVILFVYALESLCAFRLTWSVYWMGLAVGVALPISALMLYLCHLFTQPPIAY